MFSEEIYKKIFRGFSGGRDRVVTLEKLQEKIAAISLKKSGVEGGITDEGLRMWKAAAEGRISPTKARIELFCSKEGHSPWKTFVRNVWSRENWCKKCASDQRTFTWTDAYIKGLTKNPSMQFFLKETPETLASKIKKTPEGLSPSQVKLEWECEEGHKILLTFAQIGIRGCMQCFRKGQAITYKMAEKAAIAKGYKLITTPAQFKKLIEQAFKNKVIPSHVRLKYSCGKHTWRATHSSMKVKTSGCPTCYSKSGYYETRTRKIFKQLFGVNFDKIRIKEVLTKQGIHGRLEYDGYATFYIAGKKVKVAFEYNGEQHYHFPNTFHRAYKEWLNLINNDEQKVLLSQSEDVILITIPYHYYQRAGADTYIKESIISQFEQQVRNIFGLQSFKFTKKAVSPSSSSLLNFIGKKP